jgi:lipopolysaccharide export system permease protein
VKIIDKYIVKEFMPPFFLGLLLFTFVLLTNKIYKMTDLMVNKGVSLFEILRMISYILPSFLTLTIPMAVLLGALVTFGRLSTDSEITAMKASGFSFYRMTAPILAVSLVAMAFTAYFSLYLGPKKAATFKKDLFVMAKSRALINIEEEVFNDTFKNVIIYARKTPSPNEMEGVFISDERDPDEPRVIIAQHGVMDLDVATGMAYLRLTNGSIHKKGNKAGSYQELDFATNNLSINLYDKFFSDDDSKKGKREMSLGELKAFAKAANPASDDAYPLMTEYYKRFTIPLACIIFGLVGPSLGLYSRRSGRSSGVTVALVVFAVYYLIMKGGENLATSGKLDPIIAALLPNIIIGAFGIYLLVMADKEKNLWSELRELVSGFKKKRTSH